MRVRAHVCEGRAAEGGRVRAVVCAQLWALAAAVSHAAVGGAAVGGAAVGRGERRALLTLTPVFERSETICGPPIELIMCAFSKNCE